MPRRVERLGTGMQVREREGSTSEIAAAVSPRALAEGSSVRVLDPTTIAASRAHRQAVRHQRSRGWLVRRALLVADVTGLLLAFTAASELFQSPGTAVEYLIFLSTLPIWVVVAKLHGLYDKDEERTDHWTVDDVVGVVHLVTLGTWIVFLGSWATGAANPDIARLGAFWLFAVALLTVGRGVARGACRRSTTYCQNTIVVGAGDVGQLVARKALKHPEYGLDIVGFVDAQPRERRSDVGDLTVLGTPDSLAELIDEHQVERVIIAFSNDADDLTMDIVRQLRDFDLQIDVVPRLFELVGPRVAVHTIEGLPLVGLPPARPTPSSRLIKRTIDLVGAVAALVVLSPLFVVVALAIKRDSRGPVFFRQTSARARACKTFTALKFRTMRVGHRRRRASRVTSARSMSSGADAGTNGMYKLDRCDAVTPGRPLPAQDEPRRAAAADQRAARRHVARRAAPVHPVRDRALRAAPLRALPGPAGITGLWQVTARAHSTFGEALDMDVAYARSWSLGLDLSCCFARRSQLLRQRAGDRR